MSRHDMPGHVHAHEAHVAHHFASQYGSTRSPNSRIASMILSCGGPPEWAWRSRSRKVLARRLLPALELPAEDHSAATGAAPPMRHASSDGLPDVAQCLRGRCIGRLCPCLCHTSLKLNHQAIAMRVDRRPDRRRQRRQQRRQRRNAITKATRD